MVCRVVRWRPLPRSSIVAPLTATGAASRAVALLSRTHLLEPLMSGRVTVLAYHAVGECTRGEDPLRLFVHPTAFAIQMDFLARNRRVVTLEDAVNGALPQGRPAVAI